MDNIPSVSIEDLIESISGRRIIGGGHGDCDGRDDGFHIKLDDGRICIVTGVFVVYVGHVGHQTIN